MTATIQEHVNASNSMSHTPPMAVIGVGGTIGAEDARKLLGCSYPYMIQLLKKKKIKGQIKAGRWLVDAADAYRAKSTNLVKPRKPKPKAVAVATKQPENGSNLNSTELVKIQLEISREKFNMINLVFASKDKSLKEYLMNCLEAVHIKVQSSLSQVQV